MMWCCWPNGSVAGSENYRPFIPSLRPASPSTRVVILKLSCSGSGDPVTAMERGGGHTKEEGAMVAS